MCTVHHVVFSSSRIHGLANVLKSISSIIDILIVGPSKSSSHLLFQQFLGDYNEYLPTVCQVLFTTSILSSTGSLLSDKLRPLPPEITWRERIHRVDSEVAIWEEVPIDGIEQGSDRHASESVLREHGSEVLQRTLLQILFVLLEPDKLLFFVFWLWEKE